MKDPLILVKLQFYTALARTFTPFLKKYQTDEPVLPFLSKDLTELMMSLLRRFIKREVLHNITALQLTKLDVTDKTIWLSPQDISIGLGAESVLKRMSFSNSLTVSCPWRAEVRTSSPFLPCRRGWTSS